jgi:hypothetical protein
MPRQAFLSPTPCTAGATLTSSGWRPAGVNLERFRREIALTAQLQHPHIGDPQLIGFGRPGESFDGQEFYR